MNTTKAVATKISIALLPLCWASAGMAGPAGVGQITYGPLTAVPTVSGLALIAMALLLAVVAMRFLRSSASPAHPLLVGAMLVTALAAGGSGIKLVNDAYAVQPIIELSSRTGGVVEIPGQGTWNVSNKTDTEQAIRSIDVTGQDCFLVAEVGDSSTACTPGSAIPPGGSCSVQVLCGIACDAIQGDVLPAC